MTSGKVTIITPTCGRMKSLKEAVDSVLGQTYQDWEYFIVSDGDDPRVERLVTELRDHRVRYLWTLKTEYVGHLQRNFALRYASGEYVFCLDDDNIIYPDYVRKMTDCFTGEDIGYAVCWVKHDDRGVLKPQTPFVMSQIDMLNYMVRTNLARKVGGWVPFDSYSADFNLIDNVSKISRGKVVPEVLGWHRTLSSVATSRSDGLFKAWMMAHKEFLRKLQDIINAPLSLFNIKIYFNKSARVNINRMIYRFSSGNWLKQRPKQ